jgi:hypothetical protein
MLSGGFGFLVLNLYIVSYRLGWWRTPPIDVFLEGPFNPKAYVPIKAPDNSFVEPQAALIRQYPDGAILVKVAFAFKGHIAKNNSIAVTVVVVDGSGETIGERTLICPDKRASTVREARLGPVTLSSDKVNRPNIMIPLAGSAVAAGVRLRFTRV